MSNAAGVIPRAMAARAVDAVLTGHGNLDTALEASNELHDRDRALCRALAYGTLRAHERNRWLLSQLMTKPVRRRDSVVEALLSVALFALVESQRPDYAVVSVSVDAAKHLGQARLSGMVNAVLRRFLRERDELLAAAEKIETAHYQHPDWLLQAFKQDWPEDWQSIVAAGNTQPPMWLRVNTRQGTRAQWLTQLENAPGDEQRTATAPEWPPEAVCLSAPAQVNDLPGFSDGAVSVQDAAAQWAAHLLAAQPGMRVLDACAAPGGKTGHLLEHTADLAELVALDVSTQRLKRVKENLERLTLEATLLTGDLLDPDAWWDGQPFDRILLDAPCSATGVIRRHPDIRYLRSQEDSVELAAQQLEMLTTAWSMLKPGGQLLYSTCSVLRAENEHVVAAFLDTEPAARSIDLSAQPLGPNARSAGPGLQLLPDAQATDGFYYALMTSEPI